MLLVCMFMLLMQHPQARAQLAVDAPWPVVGGDAQHSGQSKYLGPIGSAVTIKWIRSLGSSFTGAPTVDGANVYVVTQASRAYALDRATGLTTWNSIFNLTYPTTSLAIQDSQRLVAGCLDGSIRAVSAVDGVATWSINSGTGDPVSSTPISGPDGSVYVGSNDWNIYAYRSDMSLRWSYKTGDSVYSSPALSTGGLLYVTSVDGRLYVFTAYTGTLRCMFNTTQPIYSTPVIGPSGVVYFGGNDHYVYAVNSTCNLRWKFQTSANVQAGPAVSADGMVYTGSYDYNVYALNGTTGALQWTFPTGHQIDSAPVIGADGTVYVGSLDSYVYALHGKTGALKWSFLTSGRVYHQPVISDTGVLVVGSDDGHVKALQSAVTSVQPGAVWPMSGLNQQHTGRTSVIGPGTAVVVKWNAVITFPVSAPPVIDKNGMLYVSNTGGAIYMFNATSGSNKTLWYPMSASNTMAIDFYGNIIAGFQDGTVKAINTTTSIAIWSFDTGSSSDIPSSASIGTDGAVYFGAIDGYLYALHGGIGTLNWKVFLGSQVNGDPTLALDGTVYLAADKIMYALNGQTGAQIWNFTAGTNITGKASVGSDGTLYFSTGDYYVHALNTSGRLKWKSQLTHLIEAAPAIGLGGMLYVGTADYVFFGLNASSGAIMWFQNVGGAVKASATVGGDNTVYIGAAGGALYAFNGTTGEVKWSNSFGTPIYHQAIIHSDGSLIVGTWQGGVYSLIAGPTPTPMPTRSVSASPSVSRTTSGTPSYSASPSIQPLGLQPNAAWPMFGGDSKHTGASAYIGPLSNVGVKWQSVLQGVLAAPPAVDSRGVIFAGCNANWLYAINGTSGARIWARSFTFRLASTFAIASNGAIVGGFVDSYVRAFDSVTGSSLWNFSAGAAVLSDVAIGPDGSIYFGNADGVITALNFTGALKWTYTTFNSVYASPALSSDGVLYAGSYGSSMFALNASTGVRKWAYNTGDVIYSSSAVGVDGTIYFGSHDDKVYALHPDGSLLWSVTTGQDVLATPAIGFDGTVYIGSYDGKLYAVNGFTGATRWTVDFRTPLPYPVVQGVDGTLYFALSTGQIVALDPLNGAIVWNISIGIGAKFAAVIAVPGTLVAHCTNGTMVALADMPLAPTTSPSPSVTPSLSVSITASRTVTPSASLTGAASVSMLSTNSPSQSPSLASTSSPSPSLSLPATPSPTRPPWTEAELSNRGLQSGAIWPMAGGNVQHTGRSRYTGPAAFSNVTQQWLITLRGAITGVPVIDKKGLMYFATDEGSLYVMDPATGAVQYFLSENQQLVGYSSFAISEDGILVVGFSTGMVRAYNSSSRVNIWNFTTTSPVYSAPVISSEGLVYFGSYDFKVYAVNITTGAMKWSFATGNIVYAGAALGVDGTVYIGSADRSVYALNGTTGSLVWRFQGALEYYSAAAVGADGTVYIGGTDKVVFALNGTTGEAIWRFTTGGIVNAAPSLGADGTVYVGSYDHNMYALNARTGEPIWQYATGANIDAAAVIDANGILYIAGMNRKLLGLDAATGTLQWNETLQGDVYHQSVIHADGTIIVGDGSRHLYAFRGVAPSPSALPTATVSASVTRSASLTTTRSASGSTSVSVAPTSTASPLPINAGLQSGAIWPVVGGNAQHSGRTALVGPAGSNLAWNVTLRGAMFGSPVIDKNGLMYFGTSDGSLYVMDPVTGAVQYFLSENSDTDMYASATFAISADGILVVGLYSGVMLAFNTSNRVNIWNFTTALQLYSSPVIGPDGTVYFGSYDDHVYALDVTTGALKWAFQTDGLVYSSPALGLDGTVYIGSGDHYVYALQGSTGVMLWRFLSNREIFSSPAIGADGTVYIGSADSNVYALNGSTGVQIWNFTASGFVHAPISIGLDGTVYAGSYDGNLYALNGTTGKERWRYTAGSAFVAAPTIDRHHTVFIATEGHLLCSLDAFTGLANWNVHVQAALYYQPVIHSDGTLIVGDRANNLYAFRAIPPSPSVSPSVTASVTRTPTPTTSLIPLNAGLQQGAPWPMRGGNQRHTHSSSYSLLGIPARVPSLLWSSQGMHATASNPCITAEDNVIFGTDAGDVIALNAYSGDFVWIYSFGAAMYSSAAIDAHGVVYIGAQDGNLHAINGSTGHGLWTFPTGDIIMSSPVIAADGTIIFGSNDFNMYAVRNNGTNAVLVWLYVATGHFISSPAIGSNGYVYVGADDGTMYAFRASAGGLRWASYGFGTLASSPTVGPDNTVYVTYGTNLCALDGTTGSRKWTMLQTTVVGSPALAPNGLVIASFKGNRTLGVNSTDGSVIWSYTGAQALRNTPAVTADGLVVLGTNEGSVYALNATNGQLHWALDLGDGVPLNSPISIGRDGTLFSSKTTGTVFALRLFLPSPSTTSTPSITATLSVTASITPTMSATPSITAIVSVTTSVNPSVSSSQSISPSHTSTVSVSPSPLSMSLDLTVNANSNVVSDSMLPVSLTLAAHYCRDPCVVHCNTSEPTTVMVTPREVTLPAWPDHSNVMTTTVSTRATFGFTSNSSQVTIRCAVGATSTEVTLPSRTSRWPLIRDAIVIMADGMVKPAWSAPVNISLLSQETNTATETLLLSLSRDRSVVMHDGFHVLASPDAAIVLVAEDGGNKLVPPFSNQTRIHANGIPCEVSWVHGNGLMLQFKMPSEGLLCSLSAPETDCGYVQLSLSSHSDNTALGTTLSCPPFCPSDFPGTVPILVPDSTSTSGVAFQPGIVDVDTGGTTPVLYASLPSTGFYITASCSAAGFIDPALGYCTNASDPRAALCGFGAGVNCRACPSGSLCPGGYRAWPLPGYYSAVESSAAVVACSPPSQTRCLGWNASISAVQCGHGYAPGSFKCGACASGFYAALDGTCAACPFEGMPSAGDILQPIAIFIAGLLGACAVVYGLVHVIAQLRGTVIQSLPKKVLQLGVWTFLTVQVVSQVGQAASPGLPPLVLSMYKSLSLFQFLGASLPSACMEQFPFMNEVIGMCIALFFLLVAIFAAYMLLKISQDKKEGSVPQPASPLPLLFRLSIIGISVPYATVSNIVFELIACSDHVISKAAYDALVRTPASLTATTRGSESITVSLLDSNPSVVCYSGVHTPVASLAWFTLAVYCVAFPLLVIGLVSRRIRRSVGHISPPTDLVNENMRRVSVKPSASQRDMAQLKTAKASPRASDVGASFTHVNDSPCCKAASDLDRNLTILRDALLTPFIAGDYRACVFWFFAFDRAYFLTLAAAQAFLAQDAYVARFCVTVAALLLLAGLLVVLRPFAVPWKFIVKVYSLVLCMLAACLNFLASQEPSNPAIGPLGLVVVIASLGLFIALGVAFFLDILNAMPARLQSKLPTEADAVKAGLRRNSSTRVSVYVNPLLNQESIRVPARVAVTPLTLMHEHTAVADVSPRESLVNQRMRLHRASNVAFAPSMLHSTSTRKPQSVRKVPNASGGSARLSKN